MMLPDGYRIRTAAVDDDLDAAVAIVRACDLHDVGFTDDVAAWIRDDWVSSSHRGAWMVDDPSGSPCAFANLGATDPSATLDSFCPVLPEHRDRVRPAVVLHLEREARAIAVGAPRLLLNFSATEDAAGTAATAGFTFVRAFWHMHRPVDGSLTAIQPPPGVTIRPYVAVTDDRLGWELIQGAFAGHFGIDPMSFEDYRHDVIDSDMWDPSLASIAELSGTPKGIVTCYVLGDVGWVGDLGVVASGRSRGIGRALLEHAFESLIARGVSHLQLNVDSGNETGATRLYEAAGMTVRRSFDCYEKLLTPG
jgi:mycothiol synthase